MPEYKRSMGSIYLYSNNIKARAAMQNRRISMQIRQTPGGGKKSGKQSKPACGSVRRPVFRIVKSEILPSEVFHELPCLFTGMLPAFMALVVHPGKHGAAYAVPAQVMVLREHGAP